MLPIAPRWPVAMHWMRRPHWLGSSPERMRVSSPLSSKSFTIALAAESTPACTSSSLLPPLDNISPPHDVASQRCVCRDRREGVPRTHLAIAQASYWDNKGILLTAEHIFILDGETASS